MSGPPVCLVTVLVDIAVEFLCVLKNFVLQIVLLALLFGEAIIFFLAICYFDTILWVVLYLVVKMASYFTFIFFRIKFTPFYKPECGI